jgi:hypothetical protein
LSSALQNGQLLLSEDLETLQKFDKNFFLPLRMNFWKKKIVLIGPISIFEKKMLLILIFIFVFA